MKVKRAVWGLLALTMVLAWASQGALAASREDAAIKVKEAELVLEQIMTSHDRSIPSDLMKTAKAVAIFPNMVKAGFIIGGQYGTGLVMVRRAGGGFGPPAFFSMGGVSAGFQIGAQATDLILVVAKQRGLDGLLKNKVKFGADLAVVAGPVGRRGEAGLSGASLQADVLSYSRSKGLFAGVSLEGAGIEFDKETTSNYYGKALTMADFMAPGKVMAPPEAQSLIKTLDKAGR